MYRASVSLTPDDQRMLSAAYTDVTVWDVASAVRLRTLNGAHSNRVYSVDVNSTGTLACSGSSDGTVVLWNLQSGKSMDVFDCNATNFPKQGVRSVCFAPDGQSIVAASDAITFVWVIKDIRARLLFLHCVRTMRKRTPAFRAYRTRNSGDVRYLMCCVARMF